MNLPPIEIKFYDENDEVIETHSRSRIPAYLLDMAVDLGQSMKDISSVENEKPASEKTAPLFDFVVELFGNKFTREELKRHSDLIECFSIYKQVLSRAGALMQNFAKANPPVPSPRAK
jgi:hypothetical protein